MTRTSNPIFSMLAVSRSAVQRLNQSLYVRKREPETKPAAPLLWSAAWRSTAARGTPSVPVESKSSSLLVILHYLLKNNSTFMAVDLQVPTPPGGIEAGVTVKSSVSPPEGRWGV